MAAAKFPGPVPRGAIDYIAHKDLRPGFHYQDVWGAEHAHGFTVAKMMKLDLLSDTQASLAAAAANGETFRSWAQKIRPTLEKRGWWGVKQMVDPLTGKTQSVQLGSARRLRTIFGSNMRAARAAGQWQRIQRNKATSPYLLYQLGPSIHHRPWHVALAGTLLPVDDPTWDAIYPPKGYGCKCWVLAVTHSGHARLQRDGYRDPLAPQQIDPKTGLPTGHLQKRMKSVNTKPPRFAYRDFVNKRTGAIQRVPAFILRRLVDGRVTRVETHIHPAWTGNVGKQRAAWLNRALGDKLDAADQQLAHAAVRTVAHSPLLDAYLAQVRAHVDILRGGTAGAKQTARAIGDLPIGFVGRSLQQAIGSETQLVRLSPETTAKQFSSHPDLSATDYFRVDDTLSRGLVIEHDPTRWVFFRHAQGRIFKAVIKVVKTRPELYLLSAQYADEREISSELRRGKEIRKEQK